ncbi:MAG TPA: response regulator [Dehalococcoidia bacterium]|nr:response regulator [Dehalococcoidia bacterium]
MGSPLIVLVESDPTFARTLGAHLSRTGYEVRCAGTGRYAYGLIRRDQPRIVVANAALDHPQGGWILLSVLRRTPDTAGIPVILYSEDARYLEAIDDLIEDPRYQTLCRPFDLTELVAQIEDLIPLSR